MTIQYIAVFCSANAKRVKRVFISDAKELAELMVDNNYNLIWGGSDEALMRVIANEVKDQGGKIVGVSMEIVKQFAMQGADKMIIAKNHAQRKAIMLKKSIGVVILAGGIGTLDEILTPLELKKHNLYDKPIVVLNTDNFYSGLHQQLKRMKKEGLIKKPLRELIYFAQNPRQAIAYINKSNTTSYGETR